MINQAEKLECYGGINIHFSHNIPMICAVRNHMGKSIKVGLVSAI